jgi:hypothetical protein
MMMMTMSQLLEKAPGRPIASKCKAKRRVCKCTAADRPKDVNIDVYDANKAKEPAKVISFRPPVIHPNTSSPQKRALRLLLAIV